MISFKLQRINEWINWIIYINSTISRILIYRTSMGVGGAVCDRCPPVWHQKHNFASFGVILCSCGPDQRKQELGTSWNDYCSADLKLCRSRNGESLWSLNDGWSVSCRRTCDVGNWIARWGWRRWADDNDVWTEMARCVRQSVRRRHADTASRIHSFTWQNSSLKRTLSKEH